MPVIKLKGEVLSIPEKVGDYIDDLVEQKYNHEKTLQSIARIATTWLKSDRNTLDRTIEKIGFSCIVEIGRMDAKFVQETESEITGAA